MVTILSSSFSPSTAQKFVTKWANVTLNEKAVAQTHFNELCALLSIDAPLDADQRGTFYQFEKPLTKLGGRAGFADVWRKDCFAWEYKSPGKYPTLKAAHDQLRIYKEALDNPPVLGACDIETFDIHVGFTGYRTLTRQFLNTDLVNADTRDFLRLALTEPEQLRPIEKSATITEKAAARFAQVAQFLEKRGFDQARIAAFFTKLVFALFAEDIRLLPNHLMTRTLKEAIFTPNEFPHMVRALFQAMNSGQYFGPGVRVPRFNGGLFENDDVLPLNVDEIQFLEDAARLDWSQVEPAIFGTLFERSLDKQKRAQLGAHYTSKEDIALIVEPIVVTPLKREWEQIKAHIEALHPAWEAATGSLKQLQQNQMEGLIFAFTDRLTKVRVLDPACGSGNFLYVSLNALKDLEKEVLVYATGIGLTAPELGVTPAQLYGIEKNEFAAALAQIVVWIGYLQWNRNNGFDELNQREPILKTLSNIECRDAILAFDCNNKPIEPRWPETDVIVGNPPFLGGKRLRAELGNNYIQAIFDVYDNRVPREADLVTYWFENARSLIAQGTVQRAGLLATNSIRGGANRKVIEHIKQTGDIFMAWSDRPWILDGTAVRVSMIGFDNGHEPNRSLNGYATNSINSDLTSNLDITSAESLQENNTICLRADEKGGAFDITSDVAKAMLTAPVNTNNKPNDEVIRRWVTAVDVVRRPRDMWIIDFGVDMSQEQAAKYEIPFGYIETHVKSIRATNNIARLREQWWLHRVPGSNMRLKLSQLTRYIATPVTAKHRIFTWLPSSTLPDITLTVFAREDDYFFGVLHSKLHEVWSLRMGGWMGVGNDPRYTPSTTFATFPFPWLPGSEQQDDPYTIAIADATRELVQLRDAWLNEPGLSASELTQRTLTNLYNKRPDWLTAVHQQLDAAVSAAYGWPHDLSDDQILEHLLALNLERASQQHGNVFAPADNTLDSDEQE